MSSMPKGDASDAPFIQWMSRYVFTPMLEAAHVAEPDAQSFTTTREELKLLRMRIGQAKRLYRRNKEAYLALDAAIDVAINGSENLAATCATLRASGHFKRLDTLHDRGERLFDMLDHLEATLGYLNQLTILLPPNNEYPHH